MFIRPEFSIYALFIVALYKIMTHTDLVALFQ